MPRSSFAIKFEGPPEKRPLLRQWYRRLPAGSTKASIQNIRYFSGETKRDGIAVYCTHPFRAESLAVRKAQGRQIEGEVNQALDILLHRFLNWIQPAGALTEADLGDGRAFVQWWPLEVIVALEGNPAPQAQAQAEMNDHALNCLELVRFATWRDGAVLESWEFSNDPFLAAGRIATGDFEWIRRFPENWPPSSTSREDLGARLMEYAREYVGLFRMATAAGHRSFLTERLTGITGAFQSKFAWQIPFWQRVASEWLDGNEIADGPVLSSHEYTQLDGATDWLRYELAEAGAGFERDVPAMINSFLPLLTPPDSAVYFAGNSSNNCL